MWRLVVLLMTCLWNGISGRHEVGVKWCDNYTKINRFGDMEYALNRSSLRNRIVAFHSKTKGNWSLQLNLTKCAMRDKNGLTNCFSLGIDIAAANPNKINIIRVWKQNLIAEDVFERTHPALNDANDDQNQIVLALSNTNGDVPTLMINSVEVETNDFFYCKDCITKSISLQGTNVILTHVCYKPDQTASKYPEYHRLMPDETDSGGQRTPDKSYRYGVYGPFNRERSMTLFGRSTDTNWKVKVKLLVCVTIDERKLTDCGFIGFETHDSGINTKEINFNSWKQDPVTGQITIISSTKTPPIFGSTENSLLLHLKNYDNGVQVSFSDFSPIRFGDLTHKKNYVVQFMNLETQNYQPISAYYESNNVDSAIIKLSLDQCKNITQNKPDKSYQVTGKDNFPPGHKLSFYGTVETKSWSVRLVLKACSSKDGNYVDCFSIVFNIANNPYAKAIEYRASVGDKAAQILYGTIYRKIRFNSPNNNLMVGISNAHYMLQVSLNNLDIPWINFTYCKNRSIVHITLYVDKYRVNEVCFKKEHEIPGIMFDYHQMSIGQSKVINQTTPDRKFRFGTDDIFASNHSMVFDGRATDNNWSCRLTLAVCAIDIEIIDCFLLVFDLYPGENEGALECDAWKSNTTSGHVPNYISQTFHDVVIRENNGLVVEVLHVNDAIRIAFNGFELRMSGLTYCRNCVIQYIDVKVVKYQLAKASYRVKNGRLRLPTTTIRPEHCSYKNTRKSVKDISLQVSLFVRNDNLTYSGSVFQNSWFFEVLMFQVKKRPTLLFHIEARDEAALFYSLEYTNEEGYTSSNGQNVISFQSEYKDGFSPIEVTIKYEGRKNGSYEFFINGHDTKLSFDGIAFDRFQVLTKDAYVDNVCFKSKSRR